MRSRGDARSHAAIVTRTLSSCRSFAAVPYHLMVVEGAIMRKRDWLYLIAYGSMFLMSGVVLARTFL